jgi:adenine-specific DNA-methyltransferase
MADNFNSALITLLKKDNRFVDEDGELIKAAVIDSAWKIDKGLVRLLLSDKNIKAKFFDEIEGHWIFNINTFIEFVSDKNFLDNSYTRYKNRVGLTIDGKYLKERGEVALVWPYKDCVLEGGQTKEEEMRKEIFFNEVLAQDEIDRLLDPKVLTNFKRYTTEGEKPVTEIKRDEVGTIRENLILKGNNLLALHCLKKQLAGKIKLIYIDPPYNTGNDSFGYNDSFNHSAWLTFMKNRLEIARVLLSSDGAIFVQISDVNVAFLKMVMDEVFNGEFVNQITIKTRSASGFKTVNLGLFESAEYILCYAKNKKLWQYNVQYIEGSYDKQYRYVLTNRTEPSSKWKIESISSIVEKKYETIIENIHIDVFCPSVKWDS